MGSFPSQNLVIGIKDAGSALPSSHTMDFTGAGVTASEEDGVVTVDIPAASSGSVIPFMIGDYFLRETRMRLEQLLLGETSQLSIAIIGDSYTQALSRYSGAVYQRLTTDYGEAASGWVSFGSYLASAGYNNSIDTTRLDFSAESGTWVATAYTTGTSPDLAYRSSTTAESKLTIDGEAGSTSIDLFHIAGTAGAIRYRWDGGSWTGLDVGTGSGLTITALSGMPATAWQLEIEHVSGTVKLAGLNVKKSTADGVNVFKLGASGSRATQWAAVDATEWQAGITSLNPNLVIVMLGVNDQNGDVTPDDFETAYNTLLTRIRAALPSVDILCVACPVNGLSHTYAMSLYTAKILALAATHKAGFVDTQYVFGESYSDYGYGSDKNWFSSDDIHPTPATGGRVLADVILRFMTK